MIQEECIAVPAFSEDETLFKEIVEKYKEAHLENAKTLEEIGDACPPLARRLEPDAAYPVKETLHEQYFPADLDVVVMPSFRYAPAFIHTHSFFEVICVLHGHCENLFSQETLPLYAGDVCIMAPGTTHAMRVFSDDGFVLNLLIRSGTFERSFLKAMPKDGVLHAFFSSALTAPEKESYICFRNAGSVELSRLVLRMREEFLEQKPYAGFLLNACLMEFFVGLLRAPGKEVVMPAPSGGEPDEHLLEIMHAIEESFDTLTLKTLSERFHYSERHMIRVLKEYTGETFTSLIRMARLDKACDLLRNTDLQVSEIISRVGYSNATHFYSSFQKKYQMTPAQYRQKHTGLHGVW